MATQRDVARLARVSSASVSRFLTDPERVRPETAERIRAAVVELDYRVDYFARSLKMGRSFHVGILAPGIGPFYWEILQGVQDTLTRSGYFSTIFYTRDIDTAIHSSREQLWSFLNNNLIEGIIHFPLLTDGDERLLDELERRHEHIVIVDRSLDRPGMDQITVDNRQAGRTAAEAFLGSGHREFVIIPGHDWSPSGTERFTGFRDRLEQAGIRLDPSRVIRGEYSPRTTYLAMKKRCGSLPPFTAVFAANDASAIGFMRAAGESGLRCPEDYSIIGFDNNEEFTPYVTPSLATFDQPLNEIGTLAAERLVARIEGRGRVQHTVFQAEFIRRESLGPAPSR